MTEVARTALASVMILESRNDGIATVVMNRPDRLNALDNDLSTALKDAFERLSKDESVRVVILTGAGRAFCAGGDLSVIGRARQSGNAAELEPLLRSGMQTILTMRTMPQPVITAVNGAAAGAGMNIALAADMCLAAQEATFGQNFVKVGLFPDFGGTYFLPRIVGPARAVEFFYTGDMIDAQAALQLGIVNRVVPADQLEAEVRSLALKIAQGPPLAIQAVKKALLGSAREELAKALETEVTEQLRCFRSEDCSEGIRAFFEKRPPNFSGK